jgi:hypothetical protein
MQILISVHDFRNTQKQLEKFRKIVLGQFLIFGGAQQCAVLGTLVPVCYTGNTTAVSYFQPTTFGSAASFTPSSHRFFW